MESLCIQISVAASTPLPLTETVLQKTTKTFVFQYFLSLSDVTLLPFTRKAH